MLPTLVVLLLCALLFSASFVWSGRLRPACALALVITLAAAVVLLPASIAIGGGPDLGEEWASVAGIAWSAEVGGMVIIATAHWVREALRHRRDRGAGPARRVVVAALGLLLGQILLACAVAVGHWMSTEMGGLPVHRWRFELAVATAFVVVHELSHGPVSRILLASHESLWLLLDAAVDRLRRDAEGADRALDRARRLGCRLAESIRRNRLDRPHGVGDGPARADLAPSPGPIPAPHEAAPEETPSR